MKNFIIFAIVFAAVLYLVQCYSYGTFNLLYFKERGSVGISYVVVTLIALVVALIVKLNAKSKE